MFVSLVFDCTNQILETSNIYFIIEDALKVFKVYFLCKNRIKFRFISFTMKRLSDCGFIRLVG